MGILQGGVPSITKGQLRRETGGCRGELREGVYSLQQGVWEMCRQAGMVVAGSWDWSTATKSHAEYWKGSLKKWPPGPFPVFHVTGVTDVNNLKFPWHIYLLDLPKLQWADTLFLCRDHEVHGRFLTALWCCHSNPGIWQVLQRGILWAWLQQGRDQTCTEGVSWIQDRSCTKAAET